MKKILFLVVAVLLVGVRPGAAVETTSAKTLVDQASYFNLAVHDLAVQLLKYRRPQTGVSTIGVATFVELNRLDITSPLGRLLAEMLMGELQRAGFNVVEVRLTRDHLVKKGWGEFSLSRVVENLSPKVALQAVVLGTYIERNGYLFLNARMVDRDNQQVIASAFKVMRVDPLVASLLEPRDVPPKPMVEIKIREAFP